MAKLEIEYLPTDALKLRQSNPRTHSDRQIDQIARSIEYFGFTTPIHIDADNGVIAGHGRVLAARQLKIKELPVVRR